MNDTELLTALYDLAMKNAEHISTLNHEFGRIAQSVEWLEKLFWAIAAPVLAAMVGTIYSLITHRKNTKKLYEVFNNKNNG